MSNFSATLWPEISRLFDIAVELADSDRAAWLARLTLERPEVSTAVQALLAAHAQRREGDLLDRGAVLASTYSAPDQLAGAADALQAGQMLGPYTLLRPLGSGGMAVVWLARRSDEAPARELALKIPQNYIWRSGQPERFARERDILARLEHPGIARLYDAGVAAHGGSHSDLSYLAMEYVQGSRLDDYCNERRLGIRARLELAAQILDAVAYAHSRLVIHRDLKPANILVRADGQVRLLDFGVARLLATEPGGDSSALTQLGGKAYTPDYASPEQIRGEELGTTSDVYSMGVVLYELLSGVRPYALQHNSVAQLEQTILDVNPTPPSGRISDAAAEQRGTRAPRLRRELRGELDTILLKALRKNPADRYQSVSELAEDLRRYRDGQAVLAQPDSLAYRTRKFIARNRLAVASASAIVLALGMGLGVALWQTMRAEEARDRAQHLADRNEAVNQFVSTMLGGSALDDKMTVGELLRRSGAVIDRQFANDPGTRGAVRALIAVFHTDVGSYQKAKPLWDAALEDARQSGDPELVITVQCADAVNEAALGNGKASIETLRAVLAQPGIDPALQGSCEESLSQSAYVTGDLKTALQYAQAAVATMPKARTEHAYELANMTGWLATLLQFSMRGQEAAPLFKKALDELDRLGRSDEATTIALINNYAMGLGLSGDDRAELDVLMDLKARLLRGNANMPLPGYLVSNIAMTLTKVGRYDEALATLDSPAFMAAELQQPEMATMRVVGRAKVLASLQRYSEAHKEIEHGYATVAGKDGTHVALSSLKMLEASLDFKEGNYARARTRTKALLESGSVAAESRMSAGVLLAEIDAAMGNLESAEQEARAVLAQAQAQVRNLRASRTVGEVALILGKIQLRRNDPAGARQNLELAVEQLERSLDPQAALLAEARKTLANLRS